VQVELSAVSFLFELLRFLLSGRPAISRFSSLVGGRNACRTASETPALLDLALRIQGWLDSGGGNARIAWFCFAGAVQVFAVSSVSGLSEAERRQADHAPAFLHSVRSAPHRLLGTIDLVFFFPIGLPNARSSCCRHRRCKRYLSTASLLGCRSFFSVVDKPLFGSTEVVD
jgi:hypothetical protein